MSDCTVGCGSSAPAKGPSPGARLLQMLHAERSSRGCGAADESWVPRPAALPPQPPAPCSSDACNADAKSLFDLLSAADSDGTGTLSPDEIARTPAAGLMSDVFGLIDADGDGALNADEVRTYESAVDEVLTAAGSPAGIAQILAESGDADGPRGDHGRADGPDGRHRYGHHGHGRSGPQVHEATAAVVADALTGVLDAVDADGDGTLTSEELTAAASAPRGEDSTTDAGTTATSLSASIFQALTSQIGTSDDTTALAHRYTHVLQVLKG